jgi:murein DD-endopeptidase MepM/ murein hydrolase activator NlpD
MASGPHLHLEIWKDGNALNPVLLFPDFEEKDNINYERNNDE